jgi:hypothetical protein
MTDLFVTETNRVERGDRTITRADIEAKLRELQGEAGDVTRVVGRYGILLGTVVAIAAVTLAFRAGKRRERRLTTVVEVRRV